MTEKIVEVKVGGGMEARPTAMLVQMACSFRSQIYVQYKEKQVNAKSIMGMLSLGVSEGSSLKIMADGEDEEKAIEALEAYLNGKEN